MKVQELRLGNLIYNTKGEVDVVNMDALKYMLRYPDPLCQAGPIPLTEEWLLKFKFGLYPWGYVFYINEEFGVLIRISRKPELSFWLEVGNGLRSYIKYVHQLQNLYFALTGEELTRKDE
jgi:hypothetical protein